MKIAQSAVSMLSTHQLQTSESRSEKLEAWVGSLPGERPPRPVDKVILMSGMGIDQSLCPDKTKDADGMESYTAVDRAFMKLKILFEAMLGIKIYMIKPKALRSHACNAAQGTPSKSDTAILPQGKGGEIRYEEKNVHAETEQTTVAISGIAKTTDGKEIPF
jgi:hypothetical protein